MSWNLLDTEPDQEKEIIDTAEEEGPPNIWIEEGFNIFNRGGIASIVCLRCGNYSFNQGDVQHAYCGHCCKFHKRPQS